MDKLEQYLDQICRGIAGPRALRQHIRQELREHLTDAVAEHESAGLSREQALDRALEEFGGPEEVRRELEATHGQRMMSLIIDRAMQWKEKTMKAKWLWITWVHVALVLMIIMEVLFVLAAITIVFPRFHEFYAQGWLAADDPAAARSVLNFFLPLVAMIQSWPWWVIPLALLWVLFEWRARSENKSSIRLALLGSVAVAMLVVSLLTASYMIVPMAVEMPRVALRDQTLAVRAHVSDLDAALPELESALAAKDWERVQRALSRASRAVRKLSDTGTSAAVLVASRDPETTRIVRTEINETSRALSSAQRAVVKQDPQVIEEAAQRARALLDQLPATTRPGQ